MEIELYADVIFLINCFMDFSILAITAVLSCKKVSIWRLIIASVVISFIYCFMLFYPPLHILCNFFGAFLLLSIGLFTVFRPKTVGEFLRLVFFSYFIGFVLGGISIALFYTTNFSQVLGNGISFSSKHFPIQLLLASTGLFYFIIKMGASYIDANLVNHSKYCTAVINCKGNEISVRVLIDTGNGLKDTYSGFDILIVSFPQIALLFSKESQAFFYENGEGDELLFQEELLRLESDFSMRLIPFSSLGKKSGLILVFAPDNITFFCGTKEIVKKDIMVGIYQGSFEFGYQALVNPSAIVN